MAIRTFIFSILDGHSISVAKKDYVTNSGSKFIGEPKDLLVASSDELGAITRFISRSCEKRLEFFCQDTESLEEEDKKLSEDVHRIFRSPVDMMPINDKNGSVRCYVDRNQKIYDVMYIKDTFEELPTGAFSMKQRVLTFIGKSNSSKTTMIEELSIFMLGLLTENPNVRIEIANRPGSPVFSIYEDMCRRFDNNEMPERSHAGVEIQETSYIITCDDPEMHTMRQMLVQFKDIPGEDFETLSYDSYIMNENRIPIIVISCNDLIEHHESCSGFTKLDAYLLNYAQKAVDKRLVQGYEKEKPIFILANFDVAAKRIADDRIRRVWDRGSSLVRDGRLHMERHRDGLRLGEIRSISQDCLVPFLREYAPSIYGHMQKIAGGEPLVFACAAVGSEPLKDEQSGKFMYPEGFVPFNLDEPFLYLMNRDGLYPAHKDEVREGKIFSDVLGAFVETFIDEEYGEEEDDEELAYDNK